MIKYFILFLIVSCGKPINESKENQEQKNALISGVSTELLFDSEMSVNFDYLPLKGEAVVRTELWSGDSWQLNLGAINYRWNSPKKESFNYLSPTTREFFSMPMDEIKKLSPAEKYDLYKGEYNYPLKWEVDLMARMGTEAWEGICHGWAGASLNHPEPSPIIVKNPDGILIPFGSSDLKALLSYAYSRVLIKDSDSIGKRCQIKDSLGVNCDDDLTALSFHTVLTNKLGLLGQSFIADVDRFSEVWNHPLISYESKIIKRINNKVQISTFVKYLEVTNRNSWEKSPHLYGQMKLEYEITLDQKGNMITSKWLSYERPDFLWTVKRVDNFEGYLKDIFNLTKK